jgi:transcriptional antiterminator NusG
MDDGTDNRKWYALFVKSGSEERIAKDLAERIPDVGFHVPKKLMNERKGGKWRNVIRPLFPGYILVHGELTPDIYYHIKGVSDIYFVLKEGWTPLEIYEEEIRPILHLMGDGDVIGASGIVMKGDKVFVKDGPLKTFDGMVRSVNRRKGRAKVLFSLGGRPKVVELAVHVLSKE